MPKKALLVTFQFTTRVVVPENFDEDRIIACACHNIRNKIEKNPGQELNSACMGIVPDTEIPFDPEKDKRPAFGVFDGH